MKNTGVFATSEECAEAFERIKIAQTTPVIVLRSGSQDLASRAWDYAQKYCHSLALEHGLPEITGFYGMTQEGEFVTT